MSNVPDDWGAYGGVCRECGHYWHASGTDECACVETFRCGRYELIEPGTKSARYRQCDTEVTDEDELTANFDGEMWCKHCVDSEGFKCGICDEIFPHDDECCSDNLTVDGEFCCTWCDEEHKEKKIGHHATTVVVVEETDETTSERIIRAQIEGGINAKH